MRKQVVGVIGVGRFGGALVNTLLKSGVEVIAIDKDEERLKPYTDKISALYALKKFDKETFLEIGLDRCSVVVVCIGRELEPNLLASLCSLEIGVKRVISKVLNEEHARILTKIGAEIINPEVDMGERLARSLSNANTIDFLNLGNNFSIIEVEPPASYYGKTIINLNLRKNFNINIVAFSKGDGNASNVHPDQIISKGDHLFVAGSTSDIERFQKFLKTGA